MNVNILQYQIKYKLKKYLSNVKIIKKNPKIIKNILLHSKKYFFSPLISFFLYFVYLPGEIASIAGDTLYILNFEFVREERSFSLGE